jgi:hypothetical protein
MDGMRNRLWTYRNALFAGLLFVANTVLAQPWGNEWIKPGQSYYKIKVAREGIFRLTQQQLLESGVPLASIDARRLQLFHRGVEQAIYLPGQEDGRLDASDYIEFYGQPADGKTDTELYVSEDAQPHTLYNLFSDSATYFLTWPLTATSGKRMLAPVAENNVGNLPAEPYYLREVLKLQVNNYSQGKTYQGGDIILSQYDHGEGWTGSDIAKGANQVITLTGLTNRVTSGPDPTLEVLLVGRNNLDHNVEVYVGPSSSGLRLLHTAEFSEHDPYTVSETILWSDISSAGELFVRVNVVGVATAADRAAVSYVKVNYASSTDVAGQSQKILTLRENTGNKSFIRVTNPAGASSLFDVTQPDNVNKIGVIAGTSDFTAVVNGTAVQRKLIAATTPYTPVSIKQATMPAIDPTAFDYIIVTHPELRKATTSGSADPVAAYKAFRESAEGGGHQVLIVEMEQLFDAFNYGEISPWAIRRLAGYLLANGAPEYFFLIGKGTGVHRNYYRQDPATTTLVHFVPTNGVPGSDVAMLAGLAGTTYESPIAIGRLNARNPDDVQAYLNKVMEMENQPFDQLWKKNFIHLSGGATQGELATFRSYVNGFKFIAEGKYLGANVVTSSKSTSNAVELINIAEEVNNGVSMITFFGHSASFSTDIDIGNVSNPGFGYNNKGRYPVILVNGCDAGNIFETSFTFGEDWTLTPNLGAIGFMAHTYKGFSSDLRNFSGVFYETAFADTLFVKETLGNIKNEASRRYLERYGNSERNITQVQEMLLQGDPAVKIFGAGKPDYEISADALEVIDTEGNPLQVAKDTFALKFVVKNFGIATESDLKIYVRRRLEDGSVSLDSLISPYVLREDTMYFGISNPNLAGLGNNTFEVILDPVDEIDELDEGNNTASIDLFLAKGTTIPIFPMKRGIAGSNVDFVIQASDLFSPSRGFELEIDTSPDFNGPMKHRISGDMQVITVQNVDLASVFSIADSTVIYWRSRFLNPEPEEDTSWVLSQFTMINDSPRGYAMVSANQFADAEIKGMSLSESGFDWSFPENNLDISIKTFGPNNPGAAARDYSVNAGGSELFLEVTNFNVCRDNTLNVVVFDKQSTVPYAPFSDWQKFDNRLTCGVYPKRIHNFTDAEMYDPAGSNGGTRRLSQMLNAVSNGDFVVFFNIGTVQYDRWDAEVKEQLKAFGIQTSTLNSLVNGQPVIFYGKKGQAEGTAVELLSDGSGSPADEQQLVLNDVVEGKFFSGSVLSGRIGPAKSWGSLYQEVKLGTGQTAGNFSLDIYGLRNDGVKDLLFADENVSTIDLTSVDANFYPYLQIDYHTTDEANLVPAQLKKWVVTFNQLPEGILLTSDPTARNKLTRTANEGEALVVPFSYFNPSPVDYADSLTVRYQLVSSETSNIQEFEMKLPALLAGDSVQFNVPLTTLGVDGLESLRTIIESTEKELISTNNQLTFKDYLDVNADNVNPLLDVTFDGTYILNGDIVSPNPLVKMRLYDDYEYLQKQDTIGIEVYLKSPCEECYYVRVPFSGGKMTWSANTEKKEFNIEFRPGPLEDGIYAMRVIATDVSGNQAGTAPYEISFEVINESTVTNFYPYPNPFSTSTKFVFTLTGSEIPDQLKIQIMSVSGRVVREITQDEIGPIRIGNNITQFAWNGTDEYGDQLANGVYLYRVLLRMNGQSLEHRATSADKAFKNGFGKLYILR